MTSWLSSTALALENWIELSILAKVSIILLIGLAAVHLKPRARASAQHLILAATFAAVVALPLVFFSVPPVTIEVPAREVSTISSTSLAQPVAQPAIVTTLRGGSNAGGGFAMPSMSSVLRTIWIGGALLFLAPILIGLVRLNTLRRRALPWIEMRGLTNTLAAQVGIRRPVDVLLHEDIPAPLTCGVFRPSIIFPPDAQDWSANDLRRALVHELEHIRRADWFVQLGSRAVCALYWFHPLVWMSLRRLSLEAERACDDAVIRSADERTEYADQLVSLAQTLSSRHASSFLGMANRSDLSNRVSTLLDANRCRSRAGWLGAAVTIGLAGVMVFSIGPVRAVAQTVKVKVVQVRGGGEVGIREASTREGGELEVSALDRALYDAAAEGDVAAIGRLLNAGANVNCAIDGDGSPLIGAARDGHLAAMRVLLDRGADVNLAVPGDGNPIIMAAREGHLEAVALLLERGANVDLMVPEDENALIQASGEGHLAVVKLLVERGANVNARAFAEGAFERPNGEWRTPLSMARMGRHAAVVAFLEAAGARE